MRIAIAGTSGHARVVADVATALADVTVVGHIGYPIGDDLSRLEYPVIGKDEDLPGLKLEFGLEGIVLGIGDNLARRRVTEVYETLAADLCFATLIHPSAVIGNGVKIGPGSILMPGVIVNSRANIHTGCLINSGAIVEHDCIVEKFCNVAPSVVFGGASSLGEMSVVGIGAHIVNGISIGHGTIIGAGSVVTRNVDSGVVAYGNPAKVVRENIL